MQMLFLKMLQIIWILVILFPGAVSTMTSCPYNATVCRCTGGSVICKNVNGIPPLISDNQDGTITDLTFMSGNLDNISDNSLPANLKTLTFSNVHITSISPDAFSRSSTTLKSVSMSNVTYSTLPEALLKVNSLTELKLSDVNITKWDTRVLKHVGKTVRSVVLEKVGLKEWPEWFKNFSSVNSVDISDNTIESIPKTAFSHVKNLTSLSMRKTNINQQEIDVWTCLYSVNTTLETLDLSNNQHFYIPPSVVNMSRLVKLNVSNSSMVSFKWYRFPLQLKEVDLSRNSILAINEECFPNSSSLEIVILSYNLFSEISYLALTPLEHLRELYLEYTRLVRIPLALTTLNNLQIVRLDNIDTLRCDPPVDDELALWYQSQKNMSITGTCIFSEYDVACFLSNITDTSQCSGYSHLDYNWFLYLPAVMLAYACLLRQL